MRPFQVHLDLGVAPETFAWLVRLNGLSLGERHIEFIGVVLRMSASGALDAHPDDYRDFIVYAGTAIRAATGVIMNFERNRGETRSPIMSVA